MMQSAGRRAILLFFAAWMAAAGCRREDPGTGHVLFTLQPASYPAATKSVLGEAAETRITSVLMAVYRDGQLEISRSFQAGEACSLPLSGAGGRNAYAFVNMPGLTEADLPPSETGLPEVSWRIGSYARMDADGLPMAGCSKGIPSDGTCPVAVSRLVSRFEFHLLDGYRSFFSASPRVREHEDDPSWLLRNICYTLHNINGRLRPFGQSAAGPDDLLDDREFQLTADGRAVLYVPENLQGDLLDNDDPSKKDLPALLQAHGEDYPVCASYVEVTLEQDPARYGVGGNLSYRFFLGEDSVRNFSVGRNRLYSVGFGPDYQTVMRCFDNGTWPWKVGSEDWRDSRFLAFGAARYPVRKGASASVQVRYGFEGEDHPEAAGTDWTLYVKYADAPDAALLPASSHPALGRFASGDAAGCYLLEAASSVAAGTQLELVARTFDKRLEARSVLAVLSGGELAVNWDREPRYIAQTGVLSLEREGAKVPVSAFTLPEGGDGVFVEIREGNLKVSALRSGPVRIRLATGDGEETEVAWEVQAPVLVAEPGSLTLLPDGSDNRSVTCSYRTTASDGSVPLVVGSQGAFGLDRTLYERCLQPVLSVGSGPLGPWLGVSGQQAYVAAYPEDPSSLFGVTDPAALSARAANCPDVEPVTLSVSVADPFPGLDGTASLGVVRNVSLLGVAPWRNPAGGSLVYTGGAAEWTGGKTISPAIPRSSFSLEDAGQFAFSLTDAGKLVLGPSGASGYSAGKVPLAARIRNVRTGNTCRVSLGYLDCYLYTQLGGILQWGGVSADLWPAPGVEAFSSLRSTLSAILSIKPDFAASSFYLRSSVGTRVWTRWTEESLEGTYQLTYESDAFAMSTWREAKGPDYAYRLGETVYTINLNPAMATVNEYSYGALMVWRTTPTYLTFSMSSHPSFAHSGLGWHYRWGTETDAEGRSYYVLVDRIRFFMQADVED